MSKVLFSIIIFLILLGVFGNAFSASYVYSNIGNLAYALALGIDVGEKSKLKVSAQFSKTAVFTPGSGSSSEDSNNMVLVSGEADSLFSGLNLLNSYIGKEINLSHCSVIIFSQDFAKQGIYNEILSLMNNEQLQPSANLVISTCDAYDYLNNSTPNLEKMTVKYYETFAITNRFTGYFSNINIGEFYDSLVTDGASPSAILGGLNSTTRKELSEKKSDSSGSSSQSSGKDSGSDGNSSNSSSSSSGETNSQQSSDSSPDAEINPENLTAGSSSVTGNRGSENIGIAVFKNDKFCGELTAVETICHLLIENNVDSCIISVDSPITENEKIELRLIPSKKSKVTVNIENDTPHININLDLDADIITLQNNQNYQSNEILTKISNSAKEYLKQQMNNYLNKVCKEYSVDIDKFYTKALCHFATIPEWKNFNWEEKIKNTKFDFNINVNVISSVLITET